MNRIITLAGLISGALLASHLASAAIVYSGDKNIVITHDDYRVTNYAPSSLALNIDINGDGTNDFSFFTFNTSPTAEFVLFGGRSLNGGFYMAGEYYSNSVVQAVPAGVSLGAGPQWFSHPGPDPTFPVQPDQGWWDDHWVGFISEPSFGSEFYIPIVINAGGQRDYAWIGSEFFLDGDSFDLKITGWAYENSPGAQILTGDRGAAATPVPEPATYGLLGALGLIGFAAARRRKIT